MQIEERMYGPLDVGPWGLDLLKGASVLEERLMPSNIEQMTLGNVEKLLARFDHEQSAAFEEDDRRTIIEYYSKIPNTRRVEGELAQKRLQEINAPGGMYDQLVRRFAQLACDPSQQRQADLRLRGLLYHAVKSAFDEAVGRTTTVYSAVRIPIGKTHLKANQILPFFSAQRLSARRRELYDKLGPALEETEKALHEELAIADRLVQKFGKEAGQPSLRHMSDLATHAYETAPPLEIMDMMVEFVTHTKKVYNALFGKLIGKKQLHPADSMYKLVQKDPFVRLDIPTNPETLLSLSKELYCKLGYDRDVLERFFDPSKPDVFIDILERDGKRPGAAMSSLGSLSTGNLFYYEPTTFVGRNRKRWGTMCHEMGHVLHTVYSRRAASVSPVFALESTPTTETFAMFHEHIMKSVEGINAFSKQVGFKEDEKPLFKAWNLLSMIQDVYNIINCAYGELGTNECGTKYAREQNYKAEMMVQPDVVDISSIHPSAAYTKTPHLFGDPGYYYAYFVAELQLIALAQKLKREQGKLLSSETGPFLVEHMMTGNATSMSERIKNTTGVTDLVANAIKYVKTEYDQLQM